MALGKSTSLDFGAWAARAASLDNITLLRTRMRLGQLTACTGDRRKKERLGDECSVYDAEISRRYNFVTAGSVVGPS